MTNSNEPTPPAPVVHTPHPAPAAPRAMIFVHARTATGELATYHYVGSGASATWVDSARMGVSDPTLALALNTIVGISTPSPSK